MLLNGSMNQMERLCSVDNGVRNQALVEGRELSTVCAGECQEIAVCHLSGIQKTTAVHTFGVKERDVVRPKFVAGQCTQCCQ